KMALLLYLLLFLNIGNVETQHEINEQAKTYLQNINSGIDIDLSFWALNEVYSSSCAINNQVQNLIQSTEISFLAELFNKAACGATNTDRSSKKKERLFEFATSTGSLPIAISYLILEDDLANRLHF